MKGSWSDLTTIACSVLTTVMMNSWNKMCFTSDWYFNFLHIGPWYTPMARSMGPQVAHSKTLLRLCGCDNPCVNLTLSRNKLF